MRVLSESFKAAQKDSHATWTANTVYALYATVIPTTENGRHYICSTAGTSHATDEPTWPTTAGDTVGDGTAGWTDNGLRGDVLCKIVLTGANTYTYGVDTTNIILDLKHPVEEWRESAEVVVDNRDGNLTALTLQGYKGVISKGFKTGDGDEYSACPPLWVIAQNTYHIGGDLVTSLSLAGTFNLMNEDKASGKFDPDSSDAKTVKDLLKELAAGRFSVWVANTVYAVGDFVRATTTNGKVFKCTAIAGDEKSGASEPTWDTDVGDTTVDDQVTWTCRGKEMTCYSHCKAYTITFDVSTGTIDTFAPKDMLSIQLNGLRLEAFKQLLTYVGYKARVEDDEAIHIFIPTTTGATYDYEYNDAIAAGNHNFFQKSVRKRLVVPNYFVVSSHPDHQSPYKGFTGYAEDTASSDLLEIREHKYARVTSNAQCTAIAASQLLHKQLASERGYGYAPMNCGQEIFDYVLITDSAVSDTRVGNVGYLNEHYTPGTWDFVFRFGEVLLGGYVGTLPPQFSQISTADIADQILGLWDALLALAQTTDEVKSEVLEVTPAPEPVGEWTTLFDGTSPTSVAWMLEAGLPSAFSPYFSPIIEEVPNIFVVYVLDANNSELWKYNITGKEWVKLSSPSWNGTTGYKTLAINPLGTKLACIGDDATSWRIISIYTISTDTWANSSAAPDIVITTGQTAQLQSLVWADDDTIWAWTERNGTENGKCIKYVLSTDTWTQYTNATGVETLWQGRDAAIKADGTIVYGGLIGSDPDDYHTYTIATDTYTLVSVPSPTDIEYGWMYDKDKLWFVRTGTYRQGYIDTADDSVNEDKFAENTDRTGSYGRTCGVSDDLTNIIAFAKSTTPELMSVISGGTYLLGTISARGVQFVRIEKPDDNYVVLFVNTADGSSYATDHAELTWLSDGEWKVYYPQGGDYTQVIITHSRF